MAIRTHKTLQLTLGAKTVHCALTKAQLVDNPALEELTTFCGTEESATAKYTLEIGGFQDWGYTAAADPGPPAVEAYDAVCDIIHTAYVTDPVSEIAVVLTVGTATRTFSAKPIADVPFGGDAGAALTFETSLSVSSDIVDGVLP